jgi:chromosome segregation ATPase
MKISSYKEVLQKSTETLRQLRDGVKASKGRVQQAMADLDRAQLRLREAQSELDNLSKADKNSGEQASMIRKIQETEKKLHEVSSEIARESAVREKLARQRDHFAAQVRHHDESLAEKTAELESCKSQHRTIANSKVPTPKQQRQ